MILYSNPYSTEKNIGKAYNEFLHALNVPLDTWIVIQDGDIIYLTPRWGRQIEDVTIKHGSNYQLFGCMTNRVGIIDHLIDGFSDNHDINHHRLLSQRLERCNWSQIKDARSVIAGFFLMFQMTTFYTVGGFKENVLDADRKFSQDIKKLGGRLGIITGLYVYHAYRMHKQGRYNAQNDYGHLK